jgi:DNA processing protein
MAGGAGELWNILERGGARAAALVGAEKVDEWKGICRRTDPAKALEDLRRRGIRVILPHDEGYPERLRAIYDPPALLFMLGEKVPGESPCVAVVGSRRATAYGKWAAETIGAELARKGVTVVSGAAYGVDGHAHLGCLKAGGFTAAVMGCGVDRVYPAGHAQLLDRIAGRGCILSEYPPGSDPLPWRFPHRNRIIAGLSHAVVVVEASEKSGALITADLALDEGREVMAVPGPVTSTLSRGTNALIQKGAKLVTSVDDICEELPYDFAARGGTAGEVVAGAEFAGGGEMSAGELKTLELLEGGPRSLDWLAVRLGEPPGEMLSRLTAMSFKGWVVEEAGGRYRLLAHPVMRCRQD